MRSYINFKRAWYAEANRQAARMDWHNEINIRVDDCEMTIRFYYVGHQLAPRVEIYDDAWKLFATAPDLFEALAKLDEGATDEQIEELLEDLGFVADLTAYEEPA